ncbi:hypothetical protein V8V54_26810, partial [Priestia megaterium]|uniref:hypothetical protein n=1 Tax=Priestia megaterium TaxID=1404 RepID=UPI00300AD013
MNLINLIFIFIYLIFGIGMVKNNKYWPFFLFFYIAQLWTIFSVYYIEQGIYITEQNRFSFTTGSTYKLVIQNLVFFNSAMLTLYMLSRLKGKSLKLEAQTANYNYYNKKIYNLVLYLVFIVSLLYISDAILTYLKYRGSFDRFDYYEYSVLYNYPIIKNIFNNIQIFPLILGTLYL